MQFLLGSGLLTCGILVGWYLRPYLFGIIAELECVCGSGNKYKKCCMEKDLHESFLEENDEIQ